MTSYEGQLARRGHADRHRVQPVQRPDHRRGCWPGPSTACAATAWTPRPITVAWAPGAFELPLVARRSWRRSGELRRRDHPGGGHPGRHRPLRAGGRPVRGGHPAGPARHGRAGRLRGAHHRHHRAGHRAGRDQGRQQGLRGGRRPPSRWSTCCASCPSGRFPSRPPRPGPRPAEGLSRAAVALPLVSACCAWSCPRARSNGPPSSCSRRPIWPSGAAPTWTTGPPSTIPASPRCASCGPRRSPLRGRRAVRPRHHRPGLDRGDRQLGHLARPAALQQGDGPSDPAWCWRWPTTRRSSRSLTCPSGVRVSTEYPELTGRYLAAHGVEAEVMLSYGATEAKVPEIADAVVEITETGRALQGGRAADRRDHARVLHRADRQPGRLRPSPSKRHAMEQIHTLLHGTLEARGRVLVKLNVAEADLDRVIGLLPALKSPTVSEAVRRRGRLRGGDGRAQVGHQHAHPGPEGPRGDRHHRAAHLQDRALTVRGTVESFDAEVGLGEVRGDDGVLYPFHCAQIADGSRTIPVGTLVRASVVAGHLGRWEAAGISPC